MVLSGLGYHVWMDSVHLNNVSSLPSRHSFFGALEGVMDGYWYVILFLSLGGHFRISGLTTLGSERSINSLLYICALRRARAFGFVGLREEGPDLMRLHMNDHEETSRWSNQVSLYVVSICSGMGL